MFEFSYLIYLILDDGIVRVWRNFQCDQGQKLVSSWLAIPNMRSGKQGMVLDWQQYRNRLLAIGGAQQIRVWDVELELCSSEISLSSGVISINSVCSDSTGDVIYFGCGDGSVRFMDLRSPRDASSSGVVCEHGGRVVSVCLQRKGECNGLLVSGGIRGNVYVSDLRYPKISPAKFRAHPSSPLNTLAVHDYAPVMASGSSKQFVKVMRTDGVTINKIRHYDGFLGQRIGPVNYLAFHPYKLLLGVGGRDSYVSIYAVNPSGSA